MESITRERKIENVYKTAYYIWKEGLKCLW